MIEEPLVKSVRDNFNTIILMVIGAIVLAVSAIAFLIDGFYDVYPQLNIVFIGMCFAVGTAFLVRSLFRMDDIQIYNDRLITKSYLGKSTRTILLSDIIGYVEDYQSNKGDKWIDLYIYTDTGSYLISQKYFRNFAEIKDLITKGKTKLPAYPRGFVHWVRSHGWFAGSLALTLGLACAYLAYLAQISKESRLDQGFSTFTGIANQPTVLGHSKAGAWMKIWLQGYTRFEFSITEDLLPLIGQRTLASAISRNDTISLVVSKYDYLKKITDQQPLDFWDKTIGYHHIKVYAVKYRGQTFGSENPSSSRYNTTVALGTIFFAPFAFLLMFFGISLLLAKIKATNKPVS